MYNATDWLYLNAQWGSSGGITVNDIPVFINQEFWKIPLNTVSKYATFARLQELVQWGSSITIHIHLPIHNIKFHKASSPTQMTQNIKTNPWNKEINWIPLAQSLIEAKHPITLKFLISLMFAIVVNNTMYFFLQHLYSVPKLLGWIWILNKLIKTGHM